MSVCPVGAVNALKVERAPVAAGIGAIRPNLYEHGFQVGVAVDR
jgi:hypothetical protein